MIKYIVQTVSIFFFTVFSLSAQNSVLTGVVRDAYSNERLPFVNMVIYETTRGTTTDENGEFRLENLEPGFLRLQLSSVGYEPHVTEEILISAVRSNYIEIQLTPSSTTLEEVEVVANPFPRRDESPLSLQRIGIDLIEKGAGSARDFSKVLQSFPGVGTTPSFRNDLIVRGGGPSENSFFLDGIEIPVLNHFSTQGASGGPVGIINVDFIREVDFYSGAFPASRGDALSSVFEFKQVSPNREKTNFKSTLGASELSLSVNTPISDKTTALFSVRRSYLQFLFDYIGLPFLPTFTDFQFLTRTRIDEQREISFLGIGALDEFALNESADDSEENRYILNYLPVTEQWNYTFGASYKRFFSDSYCQISLSRSHLNNRIYKYADNDESKDENLINDYLSEEIDHKLRFEHFANPGEWTISTGFNLEHANYYNRTFNRIYRGDTSLISDYESDLHFFKWGLFASVSRRFVDERLSLSGGIRSDANSYSSSMNSLLQQVSPRISASWLLTPDISLNAATARYYQLPAYTTLGYKDSSGNFINKDNDLKYIGADHYLGGVEWRPARNVRIALEGFYKDYFNYPLSLDDGVSLASKGADYGVLGDEEVSSISEGRSYGLELLMQRRSSGDFSYIIAYTWVNSEFTNSDGDYLPSSWDSGHLFTVTANRDLGNNWDAGLKWRYIGALPYTPYDREKSERVEAWDIRNREYLDFSRFNSERLEHFHQLDLRIDKSYYFDNYSLGFYLDIQNVYNFQSKQAPRLIQKLNENQEPIVVTPENGEPRYSLKELQTSSGTVLPSIGVILEF
ncbi:TonB-dependent receptor [Marinilabiliaceae bacterium ANBcel2]|nr:TonB-dependent receptor [Marinilabiliaceae bacterium ANBcel2]